MSRETEPRLNSYVTGYVAGNLATSESEIVFHRDRIRGRLRDIITALQQNPAARADLEQLLADVEENGDVLSGLRRFGAGVNSVLGMYPSLFVHHPDSILVENMRKIAFHFLEIAKLSKDVPLSQSAISAASHFSRGNLTT